MVYRRRTIAQPLSSLNSPGNHHVRYSLVEVNGAPPDDEETQIRLCEGFHEALVRVERTHLFSGGQCGTFSESGNRAAYRVTWTRFLAVSSPLERSRPGPKRLPGTGWDGGRLWGIVVAQTTWCRAGAMNRCGDALKYAKTLGRHMRRRIH